MATEASTPPSEEDMMTLLNTFDLLHESYNESVLEVKMLKSRLSLETRKREATETFSRDIEQERQRLVKAQKDTFSELLQQFEFRSKFEDMVKEVSSLKQQLESKENDQEKVIQTLYAEKSALQTQISQGQEELSIRDAIISNLEAEVSRLQHMINEVHQSSEKARKNEILKYEMDLSDMNHKIDSLTREKEMLEHHLTHEKSAMECHFLQEKDILEKRMHEEKQMLEESFVRERNNLKEQIQNIEKQLQQERSSYETKLKESSFNRHAEVYKQKIMRLRKENADLKLQLHAVSRN